MLNWISNYVIQSKNKSPKTSPNKRQENSVFQFPETKIQSIPEELTITTQQQEIIFKKVDDLDFNCFDYANQQPNGLVHLMFYLFEKLCLFDKLNIHASLFVNFIHKIQKG